MDKELIKLAFQLGYQKALEKSATPFSDVGLSLIPSMIPYVGSASHSIGHASGQISNPATDDDVEEYDEHPGRALIPGVGAHRIERRLKKSLTDSSGNARHYISQSFGGLTSTGVGAALGAVAGSLATKDKRNKTRNTVVGALTGASAPVLLAALAALASKRRNADRHAEYIESSTVPEYFVPGLSTYNRLKTIGHEQGNSKARIKANKDKKRSVASAEPKDESD